MIWGAIINKQRCSCVGVVSEVVSSYNSHSYLRILLWGGDNLVGPTLLTYLRSLNMIFDNVGLFIMSFPFEIDLTRPSSDVVVIFNVGLRFEGLFWERYIYFEGPNRIWRALKTSILSSARDHLDQLCATISLDSGYNCRVTVSDGICEKCHRLNMNSRPTWIFEFPAR